MAEEVPGNWEWTKDGEAEEPVRVAEESEAGRKGAFPSFVIPFQYSPVLLGRKGTSHLGWE